MFLLSKYDSEVIHTIFFLRLFEHSYFQILSFKYLFEFISTLVLTRVSL